ncbi:hypothetical protein GCM10017600_04650 [Streptosporangium carneum]|uniref:Uncharacterized protein n=1 Tax=Streptosporangium carneum TaxID=47481 RepID=A0A9W6MAS8_9ACTN|nr:hypothetical protein GCM10017600_04650 [Streptosporangium carneum]
MTNFWLVLLLSHCHWYIKVPLPRLLLTSMHIGGQARAVRPAGWRAEAVAGWRAEAVAGRAVAAPTAVEMRATASRR